MPELEPVMTAVFPDRSVMMAMDVVPSLMAFGRDTNAASAKGTEGPARGTGTKGGSSAHAGTSAKKKRRHEAGVKL